VLAYLAAHGLALTAILATHHHGDHVGGVAPLVERFPVPVYGPARERIPGRTHAVAEGDRIAVPGLPGTLTVLDIPGHTAGHVAYFGDVDGVPSLFCGDTLFAAGCGRLFEGTPEMMFGAMRKLGALPGDTRVFCGHEYSAGNLRFAAHVEPENAAVKAALERVTRIRANAAKDWHDATPAEMVVPTTIADERATNPFMRAGSSDELGRRRAAKDKF
jgi:hydroxyacylglutathione hydrolase